MHSQHLKYGGPSEMIRFLVCREICYNITTVYRALQIHQDLNSVQID